MRVVVYRIVKDEGSVVVAEAHRVDNGVKVWFAGDHRPMHLIAEALDNDDPVEVDIEPWQLVPIVRPAFEVIGGLTVENEEEK